MIDARDLVLSILGITFVALAFNHFLLDMASSNGVSVDGVDTTIFDQTEEATGISDSIRNETGFLEDLPIIGDMVAIVGNAAKGMKYIYSAPGVLINMVSNSIGILQAPAWIFDVISGFIWVFVIFMTLYFMRGYSA